jgi:acyl-CoA synthetase (AMP-forming)/AMP-acid ligase II
MNRYEGLAWQSIPHLLEDCATRYGKRPAIVDGGHSITYAELRERVMAAARGLASLDVTPGDRVAIWAPNGWQWIVAALAVQANGAAIIPLNTRFRADEIGYILCKARPRLVILSRHFLDTDYVAILDQACAGGERIPAVTLDDATPGKGVTWSDLHERASGVAEAVILSRIAALTPDAVSDIMFTSGTTGYPKGVIGRHGQSLRAFHRFGLDSDFRFGEERHLIVNPFFHGLGYKLGWLMSMMFGATVYPLALFDPGKMLEIVARERITILPGPPTIFQALLDHPDRPKLDLSSLRICMTGSTILPPALINRIRAELGFEIILAGYGLTECTVLATITRPGDDVATICETSGRAVPDVEVIIADERGNPLSPGEIGEIRVRGYNVMDGYFEDPEATAAALTTDGWLRTGDLGSLDGDGNLRIHGRLKDMYIVGGFNTYPAEIENMMLAHPDIAEIAIIGVPDERLGEVGMAFIVPRRPDHASADEITAWAKERMANYKVPRAIRFMASLPKNASGKILKIRLRELARELELEGRP